MRYDLNERIEPMLQNDLNDLIVENNFYIIETRGMSGAGFASFIRKLYKKGIKLVKKGIDTYDKVAPVIRKVYDVYDTPTVQKYVPQPIRETEQNVTNYIRNKDNQFNQIRDDVNTISKSFKGKGHPASELKKRLLKLEGNTGGSLYTTGKGIYTTGNGIYTTGAGLYVGAGVNQIQNITGMSELHTEDLLRRCNKCSAKTPAKQMILPLKLLSKKTTKNRTLLKNLEKLIEKKMKGMEGRGKTSNTINDIGSIAKILTPFIPLLL